MVAGTAEVAAVAASSGDSGVLIPVWAISLLAPIVMGIIGYFLKRSQDQIDARQDKHDERLAHIESKITDLHVGHAELAAKLENLVG